MSQTTLISFGPVAPLSPNAPAQSTNGAKRLSESVFRPRPFPLLLKLRRAIHVASLKTFARRAVLPLRSIALCAPGSLAETTVQSRSRQRTISSLPTGMFSKWEDAGENARTRKVIVRAA